MLKEVNAGLQTFADKSKQVFDPAFFGPYSFEYAYRLLLVYLTTYAKSINEIRSLNPAAFDTIFFPDIEKAVDFVVSYRGIDLSESIRKRLVDIANESLLLYIKSPMHIAPQKAANSLAKTMENTLLLSCDRENRDLIRGVFRE